MKKVFTAFCAMLCIVAFTSQVKAEVAANYFVLNNHPFKLTPTGGSALSTLYWVVDGVASTVQGSDNGGILTRTFNDAGLVPKLHKIKLSVLEVAQGCISNVVEYNIIVLPTVTVSLDGPSLLDLCTGDQINVDLTASVTDIAGLDTLGVSLAPISWKKDGSVVTQGTNGAVLTATAVGEYEAITAYVLPTGNHKYAQTSSLLTQAVTTAKKKIQQTKALPTIPVLTLGE